MAEFKSIRIPTDVAEGMFYRVAGLEGAVRSAQIALRSSDGLNPASDSLSIIAEELSRIAGDLDLCAWDEAPDASDEDGESGSTSPAPGSVTETSAPEDEQSAQTLEERIEEQRSKMFGAMAIIAVARDSINTDKSYYLHRALLDVHEGLDGIAGKLNEISSECALVPSVRSQEVSHG